MGKKDRFKRLPAKEAMGFRIALRRDVNKTLSTSKSYDTIRFLKGLKILFGEPDEPGDNRFSYSIWDSRNDIKFEAFAGNSTPSYGGGIYHFDNINTAKLRTDVIESLSDFDQLLEEVLRGFAK